jgi:hypothetical protein
LREAGISQQGHVTQYLVDTVSATGAYSITHLLCRLSISVIRQKFSASRHWLILSLQQCQSK